MEDAESNPVAHLPGAACLSACPPFDDVDALCAAHDFCVYAQLRRLNGWSNCTYTTAGGLATVPANECACDIALYGNVTALGGTNGFKGNLLLWLSSAWGKCMQVDANGNPAACVPFRGTVVPPGTQPMGPGDGARSLAAGLGASAGALVPLVLVLCWWRRAGAERATKGARTGEALLVAS
jgi:hypothetical protein